MWVLVVLGFVYFFQLYFLKCLFNELTLLVQPPIPAGIIHKNTHLQLVFLHRDLAVDSVSLITTDLLQLLSVEGEELSSGEDAQVFHGPGETQSGEMMVVLHVALCQRRAVGDGRLGTALGPYHRAWGCARGAAVIPVAFQAMGLVP